MAETPSDELAAFFVALERAKSNGLDYEWTAFSDKRCLSADLGRAPLITIANLRTTTPSHLIHLISNRPI